MNTGIDGLVLAALTTLEWHLFQLQPHPSLRQGDRGTMSLPLETSFRLKTEGCIPSNYF